MELSRLNKWFLIAAAAAVLGSVGWGFSKLGSPMDQRKIAMDARRVENLYNIALITYRGLNPVVYGKPINSTTTADTVTLPKTIDDAISTFSPNDPGVQVKDPITQKKYEYSPIDEKHYLLCATFDTDSVKTRERMQTKNSGGITTMAWDHPAGHYCFTIDSSKEVPFYYNNGYYSPSSL